MSRAQDYADMSRSIEFLSDSLRDKLQVYVHREGGLCFYPLARLDEFIISNEEALLLATWILQLFSDRPDKEKA